MSADDIKLLPCPFCGGPVDLEQTVNRRAWWGVVCRNTTGNVGGSCAVSIRPSASPEAAAERWNRRAVPSPQGDAEPVPPADWMACETRAPWAANSLRFNASGMRDGEKRCRNAFRKDYMGEPARYVADAYGEAAAVFEARLAVIDAARSTTAKGGE